MPFVTRQYQHSDYPMLVSWWTAADECPPTREMMPEDSSFVLEIDGVAALAVSLYLTNIREFCYVENFIGNPAVKGPARRLGSAHLLEYIGNFARCLGYRKLFCLSHKSPLTTRYKELGFTQTGEAVSSFILPL